MNRGALLFVSACIGFGVLSHCPAIGADEPVLRYRGAGKSREALDAMQLKPFDSGLWANLSNWTGTAPKAADLNGKVVLIVSWASWHKLSHPAMRNAEALYEKFKDKGLVVVGVHNPRGFEGAAENAKTLGITFPFAEDKDGKFRTGLKADQDPNIYFVDRSGNVRFAQVDSSSMDEAAAYLVNETAEQAANYPKLLAKKATEAEKNRWLTKDASGAAPGDEPTVEFPEPDDESYKSVHWPYMVGKVEHDPILDKIKNESPKIQNWPEEDWAPSAPKKAGKIVVIYFIDPKDVDMLNVIPTMNRLRDEYKRDAIVAGSLFKIGSSSFTGGNNSNGNQEEEEKVKLRNKEFIASILRTRSVNHFLNPNVLKAENLELNGGGMIPRLAPTQDEFGIAVLLSTDMRIRWIGSPYNQDLRVALDKLIAVDPAVRARRKAEDAKKK